MSFEQQEQAVFDLLFDHVLRDNFCNTGVQALSAYMLSDDERADLSTIRADAIVLDATMRADLILSQLCRQFPLTFSLLSSFDQGIELLKKTINRKTMLSPPLERATTFNSQVLAQLDTLQYNSQQQYVMIAAIVEAELGMSWSSAMLKRQVLSNEFIPLPTDTELTQQWLNKPVKVAAYVSAAVIPHSYTELKTLLCPVENCDLWEALRKTPLDKSTRNRALAHEHKKLLMSRAYISQPSRFEPVVDHQILELSDGFAPLFEHINGSNSVAHILQSLKTAGATPQILSGVQHGFEQLLNHHILEFV